jgi:regulatory protein
VAKALPPNPDDADAAFEKAVRILNAAAQTSSGLEAKLTRGGFSARAAGEACRRAVGMGYVNDRAYAAALVERRLRQGRGRAVIARELGHKGMSAETVSEALSTVDGEEEFRSALQLGTRLYQRHRDEADPLRRRDRVLAALARRGFPSGVARRAAAAAAEAAGEGA